MPRMEAGVMPKNSEYSEIISRLKWPLWKGVLFDAVRQSIRPDSAIMDSNSSASVSVTIRRT